MGQLTEIHVPGKFVFFPTGEIKFHIYGADEAVGRQQPPVDFGSISTMAKFKEQMVNLCTIGGLMTSRMLEAQLSASPVSAPGVPPTGPEDVTETVDQHIAATMRQTQERMKEVQEEAKKRAQQAVETLSKASNDIASSAAKS